jgi:quinol monooxygenase YgiN
MLRGTDIGGAMTEPFGLVVRFTLKDRADAGFDQLVAETIRQIRSTEPGTLVYAVHQSHDQDQVRIFYELYRDRSAFDEHEAQPHTRRFLAEREQFLANVEVDFLSVMVAKGIPMEQPA